ncbi:hypothetical protein [Comamonas sp. C11]|uniref:Rieske (2Fe-2S) protein n=1 Tax=Comamonas sp. C11 TaxID=2966554 RepID=UPI0021115002|nr:hypothetical protein [Comamonas sp. C11]UUC92389.1 hypothetical protein NOX35_19185 [Comamonas sp. C11]
MSTETPHAAWHDFGEPDDFPDGAAWLVVADGLPVAVFRQGEELFALYDLCSKRTGMRTATSAR